MPLQPQPSRVLTLLLERPGELLTREELQRALWPEDTFVDFERGLNNAVNRLRVALGDPAENPRFIETLSRRGYRFIAPVEKYQPQEPETAPDRPPSKPEPAPESHETELRKQVVAYLEALVRKTTELPAYYPSHLRSTASSGLTGFDNICQIVQLVEDHAAFERWQAEERERMWEGGLKDALLKLGYDEDEEGELAGRPLVVTPWDGETRNRFQRAVILGDPGFGKTWFLRREAQRTAKEGLQYLAGRTVSLDNLTVPILAHLPEINQTDSPLEETLLSMAGDEYSDDFCVFLLHKMQTSRCVILLDAWDEVPVEIPPPGEPIRYQSGYRQRLGQRLELFARRFPKVRILITSRIVGYGSSPIIGANELQLLMFQPAQTEAFVRVWFENREEDVAGRFLALVRRNAPIRSLARIPLMLTLICKAYQEKVLTFPLDRTVLYDRCLRGLLRDWVEEKQQRELSDAYIDGMLQLLERISFELFEGGREQFGESILGSIAGSFLKGLEPSHELHGRSASSLISEFKRTGILVRCGVHRDAPLMFLHRTFQEYLVANYLARQSNWLDIALSHVYESTWYECLRLLGAAIKTDLPRYLEALLRKNEEDLLIRPLEMAALAAAEAGIGALPPALETEWIRYLVTLYTKPEYAFPWVRHPYSPSYRARLRRMVTVWGQRAVPFLLPVLENFLDEDLWSSHVFAIEALEEIADWSALPHLIVDAYLNRWQEVIRSAIRAIGMFRSPDAHAILLRMTGDESARRQLLCEALQDFPPAREAAEIELGSPELASLLLSYAKVAEISPNEPEYRKISEYQRRRWEANKRRTSHPSEPEHWMTKLLRTRIDKSGDGVRQSACAELVHYRLIGDLPLIVDDLDRNPDSAVAGTLLSSDWPDSVHFLLPLCRHKSARIRSMIAEHLGYIGTPECRSLLSILSRDGDSKVQQLATVSSWQYDEESRSVLPRLTEILADADWQLQKHAMRSLIDLCINNAIIGVQEQNTYAQIEGERRSARRSAPASLGVAGFWLLSQRSGAAYWLQCKFCDALA